MGDASLARSPLVADIVEKELLAAPSFCILK
jgi:hypothetical protein